MLPLCSLFHLDIVNFNRPLFDDSMYLIDVNSVSSRQPIFTITNALRIFGALMSPSFRSSQIVFDIQDGTLLFKVNILSKYITYSFKDVNIQDTGARGSLIRMLVEFKESNFMFIDGLMSNVAIRSAFNGGFTTIINVIFLECVSNLFRSSNVFTFQNIYFK